MTVRALMTEKAHKTIAVAINREYISTMPAVFCAPIPGTKWLEFYAQKISRVDERMEGRTDRRTDRWTDARTRQWIQEGALDV